jgi:hypothetical protein
MLFSPLDSKLRDIARSRLAGGERFAVAGRSKRRGRVMLIGSSRQMRLGPGSMAIGLAHCQFRRDGYPITCIVSHVAASAGFCAPSISKLTS